MHSRSFCLAAAAALAAACAAPPAALTPIDGGCPLAATTDPTFARALTRTQDHLAARDVPGAAIVVVRDGVVEQVAGIGSKQVGVCDPVEPSTRFRTFLGIHAVSAAARAAVDAGELALDAPITDAVPAFRVAPPGDASEITLRHLLSHTSGYGREFANGCYDLAEWFQAFDALPQWAPPGSIHLWEPVNSTVVAQALATTSDGDFEAAMRRWLYEPLGIDAIYDPVWAVKDDVALGYNRRDQDLVRAAIPSDRCRAQEPYQGLFASAEDVAALLAYVTTGDPMLLADAGPAFDAPDRTTLGGFVRGPLTPELDWVREDVHGLGYGYAIRIVPERGIAIATMVNASHGEADALAESLIELYTGLEPSFEGGPTPPEEYVDLIGTYRDELAGRTLRVDYDGNVLTAEVVGLLDPAELVPASRYDDARYGLATDVFELASDTTRTRLRFWRDERGVALTVSEDTIRRSLGPPFHRVQ